MSIFKKNTAVTGFPFTLISATDGSAITTGTPVGYVTLDGGAQTAIGDVTPVHEGNGQWTFDLTGAEMNGDVVGFLITHVSAINVHFTIKTDTKIVSEVSTELATAQADLDIITGADGVNLLSATQASIDAIEIDTASMGITKNATFSNFEFPMVLTSDHYTAATGLTVTGEKSIDGGAFAAVSGAIAEVGSGVYQCDLLAADTNGDVITYKFSSATADDTIITVTTRA